MSHDCAFVTSLIITTTTSRTEHGSTTRRRLKASTHTSSVSAGSWQCLSEVSTQRRALKRYGTHCSPYNPDIVNKILLIHRTYHNFVKRHYKTKETPAMRLGLANAPVDPDDILYDRGMAFSRRKSLQAKTRPSEKPQSFLNGPEPELRSRPVKTLAPEKARKTEKAPFVFLDVETTGIGLFQQIVEIAIIDDSGKTLLHSLVRPTCPIQEGSPGSSMAFRWIILLMLHYTRKSRTELLRLSEVETWSHTEPISIFDS